MTNADRQPTEQFRSLSIEAGDIVIVLDRPSNPFGKLKQTINVIGQRALARLRASDPVDLLAPLPKHSHVMLGVGDGLIIHADGKTVALEVLSDALHVDRPDAYHYQVYRNKNISPETAAQVAKSAMRYFGQKYRFTSYLGQEQEGDTTQFCSRLVAHAYRAVDLPPSSKRATQRCWHPCAAPARSRNCSTSTTSKRTCRPISPTASSHRCKRSRTGSTSKA